MESTGVKKKIQMSQETAELIAAAGKSNWMREREEKVRAKGFSMDDLWQHGMGTAGFAKCLAQAHGSPIKVEDAAFIAGLMHDIGKLVVAANAFLDQAQGALYVGADGIGHRCGLHPPGTANKQRVVERLAQAV